jgi:multidrug efflux pump subunit AcrB
MFKKFEKLVFAGIQSSAQRKFILIGTLVAFILSILMIAPTEIVKAKMLPGKNNDTFNIYVNLPTGSSIEQTKQITDCVSGYIVKEKEVLDTEVFLGMGSPLDFAGLIKGSQFKNAENVAEIVVNISKKHHREEPSYLMVQRIRPIIQEACEKIYPNTNISFVEPPAGPPTLASIVMEVYGKDADGIRKVASRIEDIFKHTEGLVDIDVMEDDIYDKFEVVVNSTKIAKSGLNVKQLNDILYLAFEGMQIAVKNSDRYNDQIPLFLSLSQKSKKFTKKDLESVKAKLASLKLMNKKGMMVPVTELVKVVPKKSNPMIMSKDLHQMTNVLAETDMVSQVYPLLDARNTILETFTDEYNIEKTGLFNLKLIDKNEPSKIIALKV